MPAYMACPTCGFNGPHGFNDPGVGGIQRFYHSIPAGAGGGTCFSFHADGKWFKTMKEAWYHVRPRLVREQTKRDGRPDKFWLAAFDAKIIENDEKKYKRLIRKWEKSWGIA